MLRLKLALYLERCDVSACVTGFVVVDRQPCPFVALSRDVVLLFPTARNGRDQRRGVLQAVQGRAELAVARETSGGKDCTNVESRVTSRTHVANSS